MKSLMVVAILLIAASFAPVYASEYRVPESQQRLINTLSKYNQLDSAAANSIQDSKISHKFESVFCSQIPKRRVHNWVGAVTEIQPGPNGNGVDIEVSIDPYNSLVSGSLGIDLFMGNYLAYGVQEDVLKPHASTLIDSRSPLYKVASNLRSDDLIVFSGEFMPFKSAAACSDALGYATYFSLFRFSAIKDIGQPAGN